MALPGFKVAQIFVNLRKTSLQVQPGGVDLTVAEVRGFTGLGYVGFEKRILPKSVEVKPEEGFWKLKPGAYKIVYREELRIPDDCLGLVIPRSTLLRCGATVYTAVWDPGYHGRGEGLLQVLNPYGLKLEVEARIAQLILIRLKTRPHETYRGFYQHEHVEEGNL